MGRPLIAYACDSALKSHSLGRVILSTDDQEIARVGRDFGVEVPFLRPPELAQDETPMVEVLRHCLGWMARMENFAPDVLVVLQPTSPFRKSEHIDRAVELLLHDTSV